MSKIVLSVKVVKEILDEMIVVNKDFWLIFK